MDIKGIISNPYVIGGGILLGVVVLAMGGVSGQSSPGAITGPSNALLTFQAQQNALGAEYAYKNAELASQTVGQMASLQLDKALGFMSYMANIANVDANHDIAVRAINGDITKTRIQNMTSASVEANDNFTRLMMGYQASDASKYGVDAQIKINDMNNFTQLSIENQRSSQAAASAGLNAVVNLVPKLFGK